MSKECRQVVSRLNIEFSQLEKSIQSEDREFVNSTVSIYNNDTNYYNEVILLFENSGFTEHESFNLAKYIDYNGFVEFGVNLFFFQSEHREKYFELIKQSNKIGITYSIMEGGLANMLEKISSDIRRLKDAAEEILGLREMLVDNKLWFDYHCYLPPAVFKEYFELVKSIVSNDGELLVCYWNSVIDNYPGLFAKYFDGLNGETSFVFAYLDQVTAQLNLAHRDNKAWREQPSDTESVADKVAGTVRGIAGVTIGGDSGGKR